MVHEKTSIDYTKLADAELVRLSLDNNKYFRYLIQRYERQLLHYIHRMTNASPEDAQDILQNIFIKVYKHLNGFDTDLKFSSWLYRISHNEIIRHYHKNKSRSSLFDLSLDPDEAQKLTKHFVENGNTYEVIAGGEHIEEIRKVLNLLPPKYREVLVLHYLEEKKYSEISDILRKPPGTVASLLNRAKVKFKKLAKRYELTTNYE